MCDKMSFCNVSKFYESDKKSKPEHHDITTINCYPLLTCSNNVHIPTERGLAYVLPGDLRGKSMKSLQLNKKATTAVLKT